MRAAFDAAGIALIVGDRQLDDLIRHVRNKLNAANTDGLQAEAEAMVEALAPIKQLLSVQPGTQQWDSDQFGSVVWDIYTGAVSGTQAAAKCAGLTNDEAAWSDMITVLLAQDDPESVRKVVPMFGRKWFVVAAMRLEGLVGGGIGFSTSFLEALAIEVSGRTKFWALIWSTAMLILGDLWRRFGTDVGTYTIAIEPRKLRFLKTQEDNM